MNAKRTFALAFLCGLLIQSLGLALLARAVDLPSGSLTSKAPECAVGLPAIGDATRSLLEAAPPGSTHGSSSFEAGTERQVRDWAVLVYLDGDNDLEAAAFQDFNSMELVGSTTYIAILVYVDYLSATSTHGAGAECYYVAKDSNMTTINSAVLPASLPTEPNMGDPNTLLQFITFAQGYMPAHHYLLVLWDHGGGFYGVCLDETSGNDRLLPDEISDVLANPAIQPIDLVAFDACLMGQLEIAYELRNDTSLIVFSEESIPESGFPYEKFLGDLVNNTYWAADGLANSMVVRYGQAYAAGGIYYHTSNPDTQVSLSAVDSSQVSHVAGDLDALVDALLASNFLRLYYEAICAARGATLSFSWPDFMDLGDFALQLQTALDNAALANLSQAVRGAVLAAVASERHLEGLPGATGLGIAFSPHQGIPLELLANTSYEVFMRAFEAIGNTSVSALPISDPGTHHGYLDGKGDDVYFRFMPTSSGVYAIGLESVQVYDEDFDLYFYDRSLNELRASEGYTSTEYLEYNCVEHEVYYIRVHSYADPDIVDGLGVFRVTIVLTAGIDPVILGLVVIAIILIALVVACAVAASRQSRLRRWSLSSISATQAPTAATPPSASPPSTGPPGFCTNCGAPLPAGTQHCPNCGRGQAE